ncbi:predicted protein [Thalassiosira pseudonana CCMP1335]|uniref:Uncharacterized protein n=1 Tax=Thalassiosira pseudonana TaxID=35128 RepID=B8BY43_THAPS|nr:predicted protein [Thalassiosira pseudonana CCMP1335]EED94313.1 predicted protein [Thalassiosira pseudonana CCMP1335]
MMKRLYSKQVSCVAVTSPPAKCSSTQRYHRHRRTGSRAILFATILAVSYTQSAALLYPNKSSILRLSPVSSDVLCKYATEDIPDGVQQPRARHIPQRARAHIRTGSPSEEATRAGYIIRRGDSNNRSNNKAVRQPPLDQSDIPQSHQRRVRPLRTIRRIVHRSRQRPSDANCDAVSGGHKSVFMSEIEADTIPVTSRPIEVRYDNINRNGNAGNVRQTQSRMPSTSSTPLSSTIPSPNAKNQSGSHRVTFKSTRESHAILPSSSLLTSATLTEYMTQPVEKYSLLSFRDEEMPGNPQPANGSNNSSIAAKSRRWVVRRLTQEEAKRYVTRSSSDKSIEESNLFRLAVPLKPLIGWDLTPVIDLEVVPPKLESDLVGIVLDEEDGDDETNRTTISSRWRPLKGIRKRVTGRRRGGRERRLSRSKDSFTQCIALVNTRRKDKESKGRNANGRRNNGNTSSASSSNPNRSNVHHHSSKMQEEAIGMVGKVEEWLKPHITFEAELSWTDIADGGFSKQSAISSSVTVKSTAITSLTVPRLPSSILHTTVPSAFLVKRLGATLTSKALEICLPRFLKQLERDYFRWSGVDISGNEVDSRNMIEKKS